MAGRPREEGRWSGRRDTRGVGAWGLGRPALKAPPDGRPEEAGPFHGRSGGRRGEGWPSSIKSGINFSNSEVSEGSRRPRLKALLLLRKIQDQF